MTQKMLQEWDRTDDLKKGSYQVLKFGAYYKEKCPRRRMRSVLSSNLLALRGFDRYLAEEHFNIILTSPPYLPASSGRESYTKARAPSLIALGMRSHEDIDDLIDDTIGSMSGDEMDIESLTLEEQKIVEWLRNDSLRAIKATPVARYFLDLRRSFAEMLRILSPGGLAVVVSGKTSTFYQFATRTPLFVVNSAELLAEKARRVGFEVEALHDLKLFKSNANARPRSLDDYYETLIMLRKPY
jgi:hypothetical protein